MKLSFLCRSALALSMAFALNFASAQTIDVGGVKLETVAKVGGKDLKLNGAGVRTRIIVKVYVMGLYLTEKQDTTAGVLEVAGPRRFAIVMLRDISGEDFGQAFMAGITANTDKAERSKFVNQLASFGEVFVNYGSMKKGDILHADWVPGKGMAMTINDKPVGDVLPDIAFYNAVLKIWLGDKAVDSSLKPALLGKS